MEYNFPVMVITCIDPKGNIHAFMIADDFSADEKLELLSDLGYTVKTVKYTFI